MNPGQKKMAVKKKPPFKPNYYGHGSRRPFNPMFGSKGGNLDRVILDHKTRQSG